ncbi:ead/Ea22-like family protein [Escherichia coli]|nr:ead/Ea22-like family protein [Escherichia coli]EHH6693415.1 ead/Ea22-like family protein [Escherichia coli]
MRQMSLIEMDGFLKGKCIPSDLKVNETNAEYLVRKFAEAEAKISALSEDQQKAIDSIKQADSAVKLAHEKFSALAAENAGLNKFIAQSCYVFDGEQDEISDAYICATDGGIPQTPATDAFLAEVKTEARKEGAYFVANRMLAAWEAGFIDDTAKNAADIARMILTSTEFMANAPEGDFDRSFSDGVLEDIADQLRKGGNQ